MGRDNAVDGVAPTTTGIVRGMRVQVQGFPVQLGADDAADGVESASRIVLPERFAIRRKPVDWTNGSVPGRVATPRPRTEGRQRLFDVELGQANNLDRHSSSGLRTRLVSGN